MPDINADTFEIVKTAQASEAVEIADNKIFPILTSMKDSAVEGLKATSSYGFGLFSSVNALISGVGAAFATAKGLSNLGKAFFYDAPRFTANTLYYRDKKASEAAREEGVVSLSLFRKEIQVAAHKTGAMCEQAYDATLNAVEGVSHTRDALYHACDAAIKTRELAVECGAMVYEGARSAYNVMLPAYNASVAKLNAPAVIKMEELPRDFENFLNASAAAF
ncbi:MAG TPA: hypothetical protein VNK03_00950 [Gammaproteobacteria bacterium]|nr:hypothetical protein [Gammaproteobacteria bacterium]